MSQFRKKPVVIDAVQLPLTPGNIPAWIADDPKIILKVDLTEAVISTPEGTMVGSNGDWIIKGVKGELYPCKPDIFEATYEAV